MHRNAIIYFFPLMYCNYIYLQWQPGAGSRHMYEYTRMYAALFSNRAHINSTFPPINLSLWLSRETSSGRFPISQVPSYPDRRIRAHIAQFVAEQMVGISVFPNFYTNILPIRPIPSCRWSSSRTDSLRSVWRRNMEKKLSESRIKLLFCRFGRKKYRMQAKGLYSYEYTRKRRNVQNSQHPIANCFLAWHLALIFIRGCDIWR